MQAIHFGHRWVDDESWYTMPLPSISKGEFNIPSMPGEDRFWPQPPLLTYSIAALHAGMDMTVVTARLVPLAGALIVMALGFLLARRIAGPAAGVAAALFLAADNLFFVAARTVRPEIWVAVGTLGALWLAMPILETGRWSLRRVLAVAAVATVSMYSHPAGMLTPVILGGFFLLLPGMERRLSLVALFSLAWFVCMLPFAAWISYHDAAFGYESFNSHWLRRHGSQVRAAEAGVFTKLTAALVQEATHRYRDFAMPPYRVHIALASALLLLGSLFARARAVRLLAIAALAHVPFFAFVVNANPSVRYLTTFAALVAILAAIWTVVAFGQLRGLRGPASGAAADLQPVPSLGRPVGVLLLLVFVASGLAGNALYLWRAGQADIQKVGQQLEALMPEKGTVVYTAMAFWPVLRQHELIPYMRTPWPKALEKHPVRYVIVDDWVMAGGGAGNEWLPLRAAILRTVEREGKFLGTVDGGFYGQMKVYEVPKGVQP